MISPRLMLILAQALLVVGALALMPASVRLFLRALEAGMPSWHLYWIIPVAALVGGVKAVYVMRRSMRQNSIRLRSAQGKMWPWQIYPPQLFVFILSMVVMMFVFKRVFAGSAFGLGALGGIDVAVAVALVVASGEYRCVE